MKSVLISGANGFVGKNVINSLNNQYEFTFLNRNHELRISQNYILHFAGKAHDTNNVANPEEFYTANTDLTKVVFDCFLNSDAEVFITLSSVKAVADRFEGELTEEVVPKPLTHYGKSKLLAENYIFSQKIPVGKRVYVLRPCMIHGPFNKGNLNLLFSTFAKGLPWPLGAFENRRSYLSIDNLSYVISELIERVDIESGIYNIADDVPLSTNEIIEIMGDITGRRAKVLNLSPKLVRGLARMGDFLRLPFNSERLQKLIESYVVSNSKISIALGKPLPVSSKDGFISTFKTLLRDV